MEFGTLNVMLYAEKFLPASLWLRAIASQAVVPGKCCPFGLGPPNCIASAVTKTVPVNLPVLPTEATGCSSGQKIL